MTTTTIDKNAKTIFLVTTTITTSMSQLFSLEPDFGAVIFLREILGVVERGGT